MYTETLEETEVLELNAEPKMEVVKLNITDAAIAKFKEDYLPLKVNGIEDKEGLKKVYDARQDVKKTRVGVSKYADKLKANAIAYQNKVNTEKKRVITELESIEAHLQGEEDKIAAAKEEIRLEAEKKENERIQKRIDHLAEYGFSIDYNTIKTIDDTAFEIVLSNAKSEHEKELIEKAEQERLAKEEAEKLKSEREELELLRKQQAEAQRIIDEQNEKIRKEHQEEAAAILAEKQKIELEKRELELEQQKEAAGKLRQIELEKAKKEAAENERLRLIAEEEQNKILEAEKLAQSSDKVKFKTVIDSLTAIQVPEMKSKKAQKLSSDVKELIQKVIGHINSNI